MGSIRILIIEPKKKMKHTAAKFIREICIAGASIDVTLKLSTPAGTGQRKPKTKPTPAAAMRNNDRIATKRLTRLMNANFYPGDFHITLTYEGEAPNPGAAKKNIKNFIRRMGREYEKEGLTFRWIEVTEYKHTRIHHHMVVSYIDPRIIEKQWKHGHVRSVSLDKTRNYRKLAEYFIKETTKTMREPGNETKRRWRASRNLVRPIIKRERIAPIDMTKAPKALKGYEIVEETVHRFEHPFTGIEHLEYMMLSTDPVPRIKTWRKGQIVERDETFRRAQEIQIAWEDLEGWTFD